MVIINRSIQLNSLSGLCITKLDVLDEMSEIKICTSYRLKGKAVTELPIEATDLAACEPVYEVMPGWQMSSIGAKSFTDLPVNAQKYLSRIEELAGIPIDMISTGPERMETLILRHPFALNEIHTEKRT
jgi:adenylosuccinate synthase